MRVAGEGRVSPGPRLCGEVPEDTSVGPLLRMILDKHGDRVLAILVYGSWLRGKRDTMLDFYVLVEDYGGLDTRWEALACRVLPPNVYHICHAARDGAPELRAKYALLTLRRFHDAMQGDFHSYFWARFVQPCELLYVRDEDIRHTLKEAFLEAASTFITRVLPAMGERFKSADLWTRGFALTYRCEIRTESVQRGESIYEFNRAYYDSALASFAISANSPLAAQSGGLYRNPAGSWKRRRSSVSWWLRRMLGKVLSVLRLSKAAFTFNEPLEYLLWKIERHSGVYIEPTQRQLKHPLLFAWPLLWRLRKKGAFR